MIYLDLDGVFADFLGKLESLGLDYHAASVASEL